MNGPNVVGTDGGDYLHRERVATHYMISAQNKYRLKICLLLHGLLCLVMLTKLSADILDRLDIFVLELEELEVPKPLKWEYLWLASVVYSLIAFSACRKNSVFLIQIYLGGIASLGLAPVLYALVYYLPEVYQFLTASRTSGLQMWRGKPYALINVFFLVLALQVHVFSVLAASRLLNAWRARGVKKTK